ncbi:UDP-N-acetylmuramoyl-tripeptide--D-alanyl-D-alanine ligase [Gemella sp. zg-1178]|uniref:UDP-N-acetylmuramoyl-tripeptide--D-alanyl-D- alanine ligase n=1 Tax=Gemella sp. zg-1178 TaxID=2840372 RepID=UPI001C0466BF|nr:UDP-N-acetylmuramoyl-tripeptide--D-alanyl-D-alanine ligase [Gemella sp. zg-1178]MBU0278352.1 UDP-N-acetylmuramoyl-tripeptide--D-alanyl-D-alanine ligase [Gemella sp. zg-1178]
MNYSLNELNTILNSNKLNIKNDIFIKGIAIDSRKVQKGDLFIPFIGENVDGHDYIDTAFKNGASASLSMKKNISTKNNIIFVEDSLVAIQKLAENYLTKLNAKVIAITGSNGKTTTKDIVSEILSSKYKVNKTSGNYNNELGLPLTILATPEDTEILVLEMGADGFGQLEFLSKLTQPDFAIITNIGESHIEFFKDRSGIARGKFEITSHLKKDGLFIYNGDEELLNNIVKSSKINYISCGINSNNKVILENYTQENDIIRFNISNIDSELKTKLKGKHNLLNIMYASVIAKSLNISDENIIKSIENIKTITKMRLENIDYGNNSLIINDAYNASPTSMKAAIDVLEEINGYSYKTTVLGDMYELGSNEINFHKEIGLYISKNKNTTINKVISVGKLGKNITDTIDNKNIEIKSFTTTKEVAEYLKENKKTNEIILFKASRGMKLETVIEEIKK